MTTCKEIVIEGHPSGPGRRPEGLPRGRPGVLPLRARAHEVRRPHGAALRRGVFGKIPLVFGCIGADFCK